MSSTISDVSNYASGSAATAQAVEKTLGKDDFLKLLVAQLSNQDPMNAMDDREFIAQMAQFSTLEQMNNVSDGLNQIGLMLSSMYMQNVIGQGISLIGKYVTGKDAEGNTVTGLVEGVSWTDTFFKVMVDGVALEMEDLTGISIIEPPAAADPADPAGDSEAVEDTAPADTEASEDVEAPAAG
ncbi:MAG: flagellar hook capping protein [Peptococcaceae bacterium]|jgi:flagellar basal-body rod modification protein FlgD|nr:flagellar hook capping protein [Peptococcaceae bacterium]